VRASRDNHFIQVLYGFDKVTLAYDDIGVFGNRQPDALEFHISPRKKATDYTPVGIGIGIGIGAGDRLDDCYQQQKDPNADCDQDADPDAGGHWQSAAIIHGISGIFLAPYSLPSSIIQFPHGWGAGGIVTQIFITYALASAFLRST
jgi:hypothetical protein